MQVNLTMSSEDIKKIFARTEGSLIHDDFKHVLYSTRSMLSNLFVQLPDELKDDIRISYPRVVKEIRV